MIEAVQLTKRFGDTNALDGLNCRVQNGTIYGLVGANGSGKSTLLRVIAGVYAPDSGEIIVDGMRTFDNPALKAKLFFLADTPYFFHQANLVDMAQFYAMFYPSFDRALFDELVGSFPLDPKKRIGSFSKGMQRQAALILALAVRPQYLLLDEAFDGLDPVMRQVLRSLLCDGVSRRDLTVLIASHNLRELEDLCDTAGLLYGGKMLLDGTLEALRHSLHKVQLAFAEPPDDAVFAPLNRLKTERTGSLFQLVVRGDEGDTLEFLRRLHPLFVECVPLTLEEILIYELEAIGYDSNVLAR